MSYGRGTQLSLVGLLVALAPVTLNAQNAANADVTAVVQAPISVTKDSDLDFGDVFPGVDKTIAVTDVGAAAFTIQGQVSTPVNMTFTLPADLDNGPNTLTLSTWTGRHNTTNSPASGTDFTPSASPTTATTSGTGFIYTFIGATVEPTVGQVAGTYTGTMTLTAIYF